MFLIALLKIYSLTEFANSGFFGDEKKLGSFLCRLLPITIGLYLLVSKVDNNKKIINILFFFVPLFILVFLTSERMSLIYCILTFFFICLYASRINRKNIIIFPLLIILVTSILYFSDFNRFKEIRRRFHKIKNGSNCK